ncbi:hypothetical protein BJX99DRAFT_253292 [Aspergillus californicus]
MPADATNQESALGYQCLGHIGIVISLCLDLETSGKGSTSPHPRLFLLSSLRLRRQLTDQHCLALICGLEMQAGQDIQDKLGEPVRQTRSRTGCRTCRVRKVKCDEEKLCIAGQPNPQCGRCSAARLLCEWQGGPIPRKNQYRKTGRSSSHQQAESQNVLALVREGRTVPTPRSICSPGNTLQAANSLSLTTFDRLCLEYLQSSALVILLGKHWPWSTIGYAYQNIAVKEPMVMSAILASTASEIHLSRLQQQTSVIDGKVHYGRALSSLRAALSQDVKSPKQVEAIFITLWLLIDYENRFGNGAAAINIHIRGIQGLLSDRVVLSLKYPEPSLRGVTFEPGNPVLSESSNSVARVPATGGALSEAEMCDAPLRRTAVPLFLLWTLYFYTPGALLRGPDVPSIDDSLFRSFLLAEKGSAALTLEDLYRISRQSPARFWGYAYPATAKLDDLENLSGLKLYHRSHVMQFRITELFKSTSSGLGSDTSYVQILDEIVAISEEYDVLLSSAKSAQSCDIASTGRRVMETIYWASITFYGTIVYFYLCSRETHQFNDQAQHDSRLIPLETAVSYVLELSLRLHRSRPRLMLRIAWQIFIAGIATQDRIYQDWVSIRLRELACYGRNFTRLGDRYDEIIHGDDLFGSVYLGALQSV